MMLARHTCFCGELRSETIASSRWRSARVTFTDNSCSHPESLKLLRFDLGIVRMNQTTSC